MNGAKHADSVAARPYAQPMMNKEAGIKISVPQQEDIFASKTADSFEEAVDLCLEALERQLEKIKSRK